MASMSFCRSESLRLRLDKMKEPKTLAEACCSRSPSHVPSVKIATSHKERSACSFWTASLRAWTATLPARQGGSLVLWCCAKFILVALHKHATADEVWASEGFVVGSLVAELLVGLDCDPFCSPSRASFA